uniref:Uncharacterized protein n=1 Tax=Sus scrofa TaxID=9823 RepID=A0A4X1UFB8_PIG
MIRRTTQRPTEKTAGPHHPFFIGSRPEPVFRGGILLSLFGQSQNCDPGMLISENIRTLALLSGLRIWCCCELWCRSQTRLGSQVAVAVM